MSENRKAEPETAAPRLTIDAATDAHVLDAVTQNGSKPKQPPDGPRVDPEDPVEEASYESFPASDPPSFSPTRTGPDTGDRRPGDDRRPRKS